jgi:hypothetical protein
MCGSGEGGWGCGDLDTCENRQYLLRLLVSFCLFIRSDHHHTCFLNDYIYSNKVKYAESNFLKEQCKLELVSSEIKSAVVFFRAWSPSLEISKRPGIIFLKYRETVLWIRLQESKKWPTNRKKLMNFIFESAVCSLLRAELNWMLLL